MLQRVDVDGQPEKGGTDEIIIDEQAGHRRRVGLKTAVNGDAQLLVSRHVAGGEPVLAHRDVFHVITVVGHHRDDFLARAAVYERTFGNQRDLDIFSFNLTTDRYFQLCPELPIPVVVVFFSLARQSELKIADGPVVGRKRAVVFHNQLEFVILPWYFSVRLPFTWYEPAAMPVGSLIRYVPLASV